MKATEAQELVAQYHENERVKELDQTLAMIRQNAMLGKTSYFTSFNYEKNVDELKERGYLVTVRSKSPDTQLEKYVTYYDITWRVDL